MQENHWHLKSTLDVLKELKSNERGLSNQEADSRLKEYGPNVLPEAKTDGPLVIFLRQFQSPLIYVLLLAGAIVFYIGEIIDGSIILAILIFNAIVGTLQEGKAQTTLAKLKKSIETNATVLREGEEVIIKDAEFVQGDIIILQEGEKVPTDARLIFANNLKVDEASLTGESEPVHKFSDVMPLGPGGQSADLPTSEQKNMIFKGTYIVAGNGRAIVVATGTETVIGKISKEILTIEKEIPLKTNIRYLSRLIIIGVLGINLILFFFGVVSGKSIGEMFITVVSLSVATIPEGLPIVMTLVLATGVWRMSKRNALVKRLQAVEALGQARLIAVDKTGTITKNEMMIKKVYVNSKTFEIGGVGYEPKGEVRMKGAIIDPANHQELLLISKMAAYCANARVVFSEESKVWRVTGDPTEAAMLVFAQKIGFHKEDLEKESKLLAEIPFDYKNKYHATIHSIDGKKLLIVVGAPETILDISKNIWRDGKNQSLSQRDRQNLESVFLAMSEEGLRVVALAKSDNVSEKVLSSSINNLTFVGFLGMKDALRPEVTEALERASLAGMRVVMVTGDHSITAKSVAREAGIFKEEDKVLTGQEIESLSDRELAEKLAGTSVFARVTPEHKLRIIKAYKAKGETIAMTGDGVNDAPSLVAADLGVAMGKIGTEVAKEASDIVLLDDNFGSIVSAIEEGRSIYKTMKKVILYLFSTNLGEVLTIALSMILYYPLPILPAQIIWLNFVTDGFLDVALAMEPKEKDLLRGNFEKPKKYLIDKLMAKRMIIMALSMMVGTVFLFWLYFEDNFAKALTISFTSLAVFQWFNIWNCRHESKSIFKINPFSNKFLVGAAIITVFLQILVIYSPFMQKLFKTTPLSIFEWILILSVAASIILIEEVRKFFYRRKAFK